MPVEGRMSTSCGKGGDGGWFAVCELGGVERDCEDKGLANRRSMGAIKTTCRIRENEGMFRMEQRLKTDLAPGIT